MHIAILMTNTDETPFAQRHPKDGQKFTTLVHSVRPDWELSVFPVKDGVFPANLEGFDGVIITGSPASVLDGEPWIDRLIMLIRDIVGQNIPLFGACFGHQAIALALGGQVGPNPDGWVFGLTQMDVVYRDPWARDLGPTLAQYGAHIEQVTRLPKGARVLISSKACPIAGFAIDNNIYTTQNHPEMSPEFIAALVEDYGPNLDAATLARARASLVKPADTAVYAETIARFFEQGAGLSN